MELTPPTGVCIGPRQIRQLDDAYFSSDPYNYFQARIESLIAYSEGANADYLAGLGAAYAAKLRRSGHSLPKASPEARELQVAIDAMSLRQHAAEALLRLWFTVLTIRPHQPGEISAWATLEATENQTSKLIDHIDEIEGANDPTVERSLFLPPELLERLDEDERIPAAVAVLSAWRQHARNLLVRPDINLSAANNKVKHGLAIRVRSDLRMDILPADAVPADGKSIPKSAFEKAIPIIDRPIVEYLSRPPKAPGEEKHGLETTRLRLDTATLLAETTMIATVHAAVFHVAAARYAATSSTIRSIASFPKLPPGPLPAELVGAAVTGMRSPVSLPPGGGPVTRESGVGFNNGEFIAVPINHSGHRKMTVSDE